MNWLRNVINAILGRGIYAAPVSSEGHIVKIGRQDCDKASLSPKQDDIQRRLERAAVAMVEYFGEHMAEKWMENKELGMCKDVCGIQSRDILVLENNKYIVYDSSDKKRYRPVMFTSKAVEAYRNAHPKTGSSPRKKPLPLPNAGESEKIGVVGAMEELEEILTRLKESMSYKSSNVGPDRASVRMWGLIMRGVMMGKVCSREERSTMAGNKRANKRFTNEARALMIASIMREAIDVASTFAEDPVQYVIDNIIDVVPRAVIISSLVKHPERMAEVLPVKRLISRCGYGSWTLNNELLAKSIDLAFMISSGGIKDPERGEVLYPRPSWNLAGEYIFGKNWPAVRPQLEYQGEG